MVFFVGIGLIGYIVRLFNRLVSVRFPFCVCGWEGICWLASWLASCWLPWWRVVAFRIY